MNRPPYRPIAFLLSAAEFLGIVAAFALFSAAVVALIT